MKSSFKIGHHTDLENITGCTVILCPEATVASCYIGGSAPGSRELALLAPDKKIESIHALLLTGGSAFGLNAASGVMQFLEEKNIGYSTPYGLIPIVPAAVIYDLNIGNNKIRPTAEDTYQACTDAGADFSVQGSMGAGTGATVGKWAGIKSGMKGGIGIKEIKNGKAWVLALSVVNAVGDIINYNGEIIAGALDKNNNFLANAREQKRWFSPATGFGQNTVLSVIMTNIRLTKLQTYILARRGQNGLARSIIPASTSYDGDVIFSLSHGEVDLDPEIAYEMGAAAIQASIIESAFHAQSMGGFLASAELIREKHI